MSDFNDVAFIHRVGLSHSIYAVTLQTEAATPDLPGRFREVGCVQTPF